MPSPRPCPSGVFRTEANYADGRQREREKRCLRGGGRVVRLWFMTHLRFTPLALMLFTIGCSQTHRENTFIRVNNLGYLPGDAKIGVLSSDLPIEGNFSVGE